MLSITNILWGFEPAINILDINYEEFIEKNYNDFELEDGYLSLEKKLYYFGTKIEYCIGFQKSNHENFYIFFYSPEEVENFIEFYSDMIKWYSDKSDIVVFKDDFDLKESQPTFNFYIDNNFPVQIYRKESMKTGFRGFGITLNIDKKYIREDKTWIYWENLFDSELNDLNNLVLEEITSTSSYINKLLYVDELSFRIKESDFKEDYYFKEIILQPNKSYKITVEGCNNIESLKNYRIISKKNAYNFNYLKANSHLQNIKTDEHPKFIVITGDKSESIEYDLLFTIKELNDN